MGICTIENYLPRRIIAGAGCALGVLSGLPAGKTLVIADAAVSRTQAVQHMEGSLSKGDIYIQAPGEPTFATAQAALDYARAGGYENIIGIGGGSVLDTAKAVALLLHGTQSVAQGAAEKELARRAPLALIPTTAGTGSETTQNAIFVNEHTGVKTALISSGCIPDTALLDPLLTVSLPASVTAYSGMDALCHCVESYISIKATAISRMFSRQGIDLILSNLPRAIHRPDDLQARENMLYAALCGGAALAQAGTTTVHALSYSLGKRGVPHGVANSVLFQKVIEATVPEPGRHIPRYGEMLKLLETLPIPAIGTYGLLPGEAPTMAQEAMQQTRLLNNHPFAVDEQTVSSIFLDFLK